MPVTDGVPTWVRDDSVPHLQPLLQDLVPTTAAPTTALSGRDGQIRPSGVQGVFHNDVRVLSQAVLRVDGREPETILAVPHGPHTTLFIGLARWLGDQGADPTVRIRRRRTVSAHAVTEHLEIASAAARPVTADVTVDLGCDLAQVEAVKSGDGGTPLQPSLVAATLRWRSAEIEIGVDAPHGVADAANARLSWRVDVPAGGRVALRWSLSVTDRAAVMAAPTGPVEWTRPAVTADDHRLVKLLGQALDDLESLRLTEPGHPHDVFLGAGVPWFLTLFGRDSLWAARMTLPLGTTLAGGTLRALARRQGTRLDPETGEAPGKIMHELRRHEFTLPAEHLRLPAAYYGTIDATLLWISLLHDAWRWGLPDEQVAALLPHLDAALGWLESYADPDGDGFVEYIDTSGHGLANQGWKDSGDAVRFADGRLATAPIALVEVQGYAYEAARHGAHLLEAFERPGAGRWHRYADELAARFRQRFWTDDGYPALALDRDLRPVDSLTSNIGHLLGTGLLSADEEARVADLLAAPAMSTGYGLRTMSSANAGYNPMSYHCGSVWAHDTAIVLARAASGGHHRLAGQLVDGLLTAAEAFDYRLPELYCGDSRADVPRPIPYPAACRPQAWSAAAAVVILQATLGITADAPAGTVTVRPLAGRPLGAVNARGLRIGGQPLDVSVRADGSATMSCPVTPIPRPRLVPGPAELVHRAPAVSTE